jgi:Acetyltransferase (GNAT) domain
VEKQQACGQVAGPLSAIRSKSQMRTERYLEASAAIWNNFVKQSKNGTFLFLRDYMEYHQNRFEDYSLLVWENSDLIALLPANKSDASLVSHAGLTYGGFVVSGTMKLPKMLEVFEATLLYLEQNGFDQLIYKTIPFIYHRAPAEEDRYALFLCQAHLVRRGVMAVTDSRASLPWQERRKRGMKKARQSGIVVKQSDEWASYWQLLTERLLETYHVQPAHSIAEIQLLRSKFAQEIKLFCAFEASTMIAGVVIYETEQVARTQYIAANSRGREVGALDLLFHELLTDIYKTKAYFDFGTSDESDGRFLNKGLLDQKEGYGARVVVQDHYRISLKEWKPGQLLGAMR